VFNICASDKTNSDTIYSDLVFSIPENWHNKWELGPSVHRKDRLDASL